jgi:hypothetical protein
VRLTLVFDELNGLTIADKSIAHGTSLTRWYDRVIKALQEKYVASHLTRACDGRSFMVDLR